jgi:hypothetical protein
MPKTTDSITRLRDELCHYCGKAPGATLDHIVPDLFGGKYALWNLVPACQPCNHDKGSKWPTCECEKCQNAIKRHIGDPVFRASTMKVLDGQEKSLVTNVRMLREKCRALETTLGAFRQRRRDIEAALTNHSFESKVEA